MEIGIFQKWFNCYNQIKNRPCSAAWPSKNGVKKVYFVKIIANDQIMNQFQVPEEFLQTDNIDMIALFNRFNLDHNELFDNGNKIILVEVKNGIETILHTFNKWW